MLVVLLLVLILTFLAYYKYSFTYWKRHNVPYVTPRIPWGNYTNVFTSQIHFGDAMKTMYQEMKSYGNRFFGIFLFSRPCFIPIDPNIIKTILVKDFQNFSHRTLYYNEKDDPISAHLLSLNGDKWKRLRSRVTPTFSSAKTKILFKIFMECGKVLDDILDQHYKNKIPINVKEMFSSFAIDVIVNVTFGLETDRLAKNEFKKHVNNALNFDIVRCVVMYLGAVFPRFCHLLGLRQVCKSSGDFFINIVKDTVDYREKTNMTRNDFMQLMVDVKNEKIPGEKVLTIEEIAAQCFIFLLAGYETSASTMSFALYEIASNDQIYGRVINEIRLVLEKYNNEITYEALQEMKYLDQIIEETLRKYSPAYIVSRVCINDYQLPGTNIVIQKGVPIMIPIRALHFDPEFYPEPEKFDPERFSPINKPKIKPYTYLPFGEGPRNCIGKRFGFLETKIGLVMALKKYRFKVNPRTITPFQINPKNLLFDVIGGIWLNCEQI